MKNLILIAALCFTIGTQAQVIPNGDFENWTNGNPDSWSTYNDLATLLGIVPAPVTQETPAPSGNSYLKATSRFSFLAGDNIPGVALLGNADFVNATGSIGIPFTQTPAFFSGVFKHEIVSPTDSMIIVCQLTKWDPESSSQISIGAAFGFNFGNSVSNWTNFSYPIQYESTELPDSLSIGVVSIGEDGASVSIDNLAFSSNGVGIEINPLLETSVSVYPNPCKNECFLDLSGIEALLNRGVKVEIIDMNGQVIETYSQVKTPLLSLNTSNFSSGKYIVRISNSYLRLNKTFIKQ